MTAQSPQDDLTDEEIKEWIGDWRRSGLDDKQIGEKLIGYLGSAYEQTLRDADGHEMERCKTHPPSHAEKFWLVRTCESAFKDKYGAGWHEVHHMKQVLTFQWQSKRGDVERMRRVLKGFNDFNSGKWARAELMAYALAGAVTGMTARVNALTLRTRAPGPAGATQPGAAGKQPGRVLVLPRPVLEETGPRVRVLLVGPETEAEFQYASDVLKRGGTAVAVNPVKTEAATAFEAKGGTFVQGPVESLPREPVFDLITEDFPFPSGKVLPTAMVEERIARLRSGGNWVLLTEKEDFSEAVRAAAELKGAKVFTRGSPQFHDAMPRSGHVRDSARFILIIRK